MSLNRNNSLHSLLRNTVPYWCGVLIFFFSALLVILGTLRQQEQEKARILLSRYQAVYQHSGPTGLQLAYSSAQENSGSFLRLEGPGLRMILLNNTDHDGVKTLLDFTTFPATINLVWHALQPGRTRGEWTISATRLANGNSLQVGINSSESLHLLQCQGRVLLLPSLFFLPLCLIPAWLNGRRGTKNLRRLTAQINSISKTGLNELQPEHNTDREAQHLIEAVQGLITRHQQLAAELQESMDNVAHDLRTPMTRLRAIAEYGLQKEQDPAHLREALADCLEESDRVLSMLNTMLHVAEAEADTVQLDLQPVSLTDSLRDVLDLYSILAEEEGVTIHCSMAPNLTILADRQRISQVWANLLDNAIKYNGSQITITTRRQGDRAEVIIQDNGMGISETELPQVWNRLFRGDRSRSKPGLGLGLTLVRATVYNHNGTIQAKSVLNEGTSFTVDIPLVAAP